MTALTTPTTETLAIHGGRPVRAARRPANPVFSQAAKDEVLALLDAGTLAQFYGGAQVRRFESAYAGWFGRRQAVATSSGTAALHLAYAAARLPERSEVLVPANAYVSAVSALLQVGLVPVIVDIDPVTWAMDPQDCADKLTPRTRAMVPVHMYGQPCPMGQLTDLARTHELVVVEDCGQSHGAVCDGRLTGTFGLAAAFSLCCRKHVAIGEGGIVITDNDTFAATVRSLAHKGKGEGWFDYREMGYSYNLTEIQGVLGRHQLARLEDELRSRASLAAMLRTALADTGMVFPETRPGSTHALFKLNALVPEHLAPFRNEIVDAIQAENVGCDPSHPCLLDIGWLREQRPSFFATLPADVRPDYRPQTVPVAHAVLARQICIEVGPGLDEEDMAFTIAAVGKVLRHYQGRRHG
ncbi:MAG TPA: DegT/DnrJ/EryC1/StrS family aminotransferase [Micromonosporaceae bacterium]|nr:DegT/DnrJ/EryC1/StrS family aminotransferase [Micromonosporaceae bacterium]